MMLKIMMKIIIKRSLFIVNDNYDGDDNDDDNYNDDDHFKKKSL